MSLSILDTFIGTHCEACGGGKQPNSAFCTNCYFSLSPSARKALWNRFGHGFEEAYAQALAVIKARKETE